jgi:hypothetical protein
MEEQQNRLLFYRDILNLDDCNEYDREETHLYALLVYVYHTLPVSLQEDVLWVMEIINKKDDFLQKTSDYSSISNMQPK